MRRTTERYQRVVNASAKGSTKGKASKPNAAVALAVSMGAAAVLLTGCGQAGVADRADPAAPGDPVAAPARPTKAATRCPVIDPTAPQSPPILIDGTPANTPEGERLSRAIGDLGYGAFADVYSTQIVDHPAGRVALCVTDLARGKLLVAAAHAADPQADPARADLYLSTYAHQTLQAAGDKLIGLRVGFPVYSVSSGHGEAVEVTSTKEGAASAEFKAKLEKATGGIPVTVTEGEQPTLLEGPMTAAP